MTQFEVPMFTVTPAFWGGANARGEPELRVPSLRGALRYWLRAMLGGIYGDSPQGIQTLRQEEGRLLGSAADRNSASSLFQIRITQILEQRSTPFSQLVGMDANHNPSQPGTAYLYFAARGTNQECERKGLTARFTLRISSRPGLRVPTHDWMKLYSSLWLLTHLGAAGSRSRRGAGSLQTLPVALPAAFASWPRLEVQADSAHALKEELESGLNFFRSQLGTSYPHAYPSEFDLLAPDVCKILVLNREFATWNQAVNAFGVWFKRFRDRRRPDYSTVKNGILGVNSLTYTVERAAFGLPIPYFYRSIPTPSNKATLQARSTDRRSSPLIIRPVQLKTGKVVIVLIWFKSRFLPAGEQLVLKVGRNSVPGPLPEDALIQMFLHGSSPDPMRPSLHDSDVPTLEVNYE